ncbi:T9SS type A sorting domain-containing protein [Spirosoma aerophilum]
MKNILLLMLGLVAGTASFAQTTPGETPDANLALTSSHKLKLMVGQQDAKGTIALIDNAGHILYNDSVNLRKGINQNFNIDELASGTYQIVVKIGKQSIVKTFVVDEKPAQTVVTLNA